MTNYRFLFTQTIVITSLGLGLSTFSPQVQAFSVLQSMRDSGPRVSPNYRLINSEENANFSQYISKPNGENKATKSVIVFIHGVIGNSKDTWTNPDTNVYWPGLVRQDPDFSDAAIYVYNYPSPAFGQSLSIDELAENLRLTLASDEILNYREIMFVAHSMGGLVTRAFLLKNLEVGGKVRFLHFLGTPTTGSSVATLASFLSKNPQFGKMVAMKSDDYLADQVRAWLTSPLRSLPTFCAYETQDTYLIRIVEMKSATFLCNQPLDPISENHIDIVKPKNRIADAYKSLKNAFVQTGKAGFRAEKPRVYIRSSILQNGVPCLTFAFSNLPLNFALDRIRLNIIEAKGPSKIPVDQAASNVSVYVTHTIDERVFITLSPIDIFVRAQATQVNDSLYVDYCPNLRRKGFKGTLTVKPDFLSPNGPLPIKDLEIFSDESNDKITLTVSHPNNVQYSVSPVIP